jgi:hypothetical protein
MGLGVLMMAHRGGNRLLARHFRLALLQAGFGWAEGYAGAEVYARPGETRLLAAAWAAIVGQPAFIETAVGQGWANPTEMAGLPAALHEWGERPDAYAAA